MNKKTEIEHATKIYITQEIKKSGRIPQETCKKLSKRIISHSKSQRRTPLCYRGVRLIEMGRTPLCKETHVHLTVRNSKIGRYSIEA